MFAIKGKSITFTKSIDIFSSLELSLPSEATIPIDNNPAALSFGITVKILSEIYAFPSLTILFSYESHKHKGLRFF